MAQYTDLKFFTNEPERDLYSRFAAVLKSSAGYSTQTEIRFFS